MGLDDQPHNERGTVVDIFIEGLEVYGHHGVGREEKVLGQRFLFDARLTLDECKAAKTDQMEDTVDYTEVLDLIVEVATVKSYCLLEKLVEETAEAILRKFPFDEVWVQVTKPHPPVACALVGVGAAVELQRADLEG